MFHEHVLNMLLGIVDKRACKRFWKIHMKRPVIRNKLEKKNVLQHGSSALRAVRSSISFVE